jgi:hypothetical protein
MLGSQRLLRDFPQFDSVARGKNDLSLTSQKLFLQLTFRSKKESIYSWWCPSVNSFKFQPCDHTPPRTQRLVISRKMLGESSM